ncbi:hypothetical protein BDR07DRAFT_1496848 [Suillus spraguei]|nr:hypothetical protein BDR07DRAFT_1496848 [Suillus spraguei]
MEALWHGVRANSLLSHCQQAEAEYIALTSVAREVLYLQLLLKELYMPPSLPTPIFCDNQAAIVLASTTPIHDRPSALMMELRGNAPDDEGDDLDDEDLDNEEDNDHLHPQDQVLAQLSVAINHLARSSHRTTTSDDSKVKIHGTDTFDGSVL